MNRYHTIIISSILLAFFSILLVLLSCETMAQSYSITVTSGDIDRTESIVSFKFPDHVEPGLYRLQSGGHTPYLQVDDQNRGWFILDQLPAGEARMYRFNNQIISADPAVSKSIDTNTISINSNGNEVIRYYHGLNDPADVLDDRYKRGGYIHPVRSPGGAILTNHLDPDGHPHHSGIWSAWANTEFQGRTPDFWNVHDNTGRVDQQDSLDVAWEGPVHAGFRAKHQFVDLSAPSPTVALNEEWAVRVYPSAGGGNIHVFDLKVTQTANTGHPLKLPEYRYGGVGFRGHPDWDGSENATFLTSEGLGRDGHATRVRWTHIGGYSDEELAGISILGHPDNYRHPQPVRIHPDDPFFNYAPVQLGDMSIEPGSTYIVRYRYITYDGEPDPDLIDNLWYDYAYPVGVTFKKQ